MLIFCSEVEILLCVDYFPFTSSSDCLDMSSITLSLHSDFLDTSAVL